MDCIIRSILVIFNICLVLVAYYVLFKRKTPESVIVWGAAFPDRPGYISLFFKTEMSTIQDEYLPTPVGLYGFVGKIRIEHFPDTTAEKPRKFLIVALEE